MLSNLGEIAELLVNSAVADLNSQHELLCVHSLPA